jgi:endogenous inhibitor of DNA gyrase (YacG/DUF329 family)
MLPKPAQVLGVSTTVEPCPYCGAAVPPEPASDAPLVCPRCGGVRLTTAARSEAEAESHAIAVIEATEVRTSAAVWRVLALTVGSFAVFSALVVALVMDVADPPLAANAIAFAGTLAPLAFAAFAWRRARQRSAELGPALHRVGQASGSTAAARTE